MNVVPSVPTKELLNGNRKNYADKIVQGRRGALQCFLEGEMERLARQSKGVPAILGIDGLAGAGKGGTLRMLQEMNPELMENAVIFEQDWFIGTERDTPEREELTSHGYDHFKDHYMRRGLMYATLVELIRTIQLGRKKTLSLMNPYLREGENSGHFGEKTLVLPGEPSLLVVEGASATKLLKKLEKKEGLKAWKMMIWTTTKRALFKAALRDRKKRGKSFMGSYRAHADQYPHLIEMLSPALDNADVICDRNNGFENYWNKLTDNDEKKAFMAEVIQEIIDEIGYDGLVQLFPDGLPTEESLMAEIRAAA